MILMRLARTCFVALVATSALTASAERSMRWAARGVPQPVLRRQGDAKEQTGGRDEQALSESLRSDVAQHPDEFVVFETRAAAERFLRNHLPDSSRETEPAMVARGILGYWRGRTLVVVPPLQGGPIL
jgi:hypothetical protein